jgi:hypothetical protein
MRAFQSGVGQHGTGLQLRERALWSGGDLEPGASRLAVLAMASLNAVRVD